MNYLLKSFLKGAAKTSGGLVVLGFTYFMYEYCCSSNNKKKDCYTNTTNLTGGNLLINGKC